MQSLCETEGWQLKLRLSDFRGWGQLIQPLCKSSRIGLPSQILLALQPRNSGLLAISRPSNRIPTHTQRPGLSYYEDWKQSSGSTRS